MYLLSARLGEYALDIACRHTAPREYRNRSRSSLDELTNDRNA